MPVFRLAQTCGGCPESYDVWRDGHLVGGLRLRHGTFSAWCGDELVYTAEPRGDGIFEEGERDRYLTEACRAILVALSPEPLYEINGGGK